MLRESLHTLQLLMKSRDSYFKEQLECFKEILAGLQEVPELVHASNSATTLWHAETIFSVVRMGDSMYGLNPSGQVLELPYELKPALTLESAIVHVKTVPAGLVWVTEQLIKQTVSKSLQRYR